MPDSARFALHRPELSESLDRGEQKILRLLQGSSRQLGANEVLIEPNRDHPYVYRLLSGWICRIRALPDGRDQCILMFLPGDLFAVKSMFVDRHPDQVRTLSRCVVESIHHRELHRVFAEDVDVANRCMWQVVEEERRLHNWVVSLGQGSADERLAMLLIDFHGRLQGAGVCPQGSLQYEMPLTQSQLADHLGITAIHVNRVLKGFRESGIVVVRDSEVKILDLFRLSQIAYPLLDVHERTSVDHVGTRGL
jgi:CRP/FNR family transcriptional regulator, anaerobic regulatory protein